MLPQDSAATESGKGDEMTDLSTPGDGDTPQPEREGAEELLDTRFLVSLGSDLDDDDLVREMLKMFLDLLPARVRDLREALDQSNPDVVRRAAHALASSAVSLGVNPLANALRQLERATPGSDHQQLVLLGDAALELVPATEETIRSFLSQQVRP